jgi:uncharacterized protein YqeY
MSLEKKIMNDLKEAMRNKDKAALRSLRSIKSAILLHQTSGSEAELDEAGEIKLLQKLVKQRKDSLSIYKEQGREDLASVEEEEIKVIEQYLPAQLDQETLEKEIKNIIAESGASSMKDMGRVMGLASKKFAGQADGKTISSIIRSLLSS